MEMGSFHDFDDVPEKDDRAKKESGRQRENRLDIIRDRIATGYYDRPDVRIKLADILVEQPEINGATDTADSERPEDDEQIRGIAG